MAEAREESSGNGLKRRNATRRKEVHKMKKGYKNIPPRKGETSESDGGRCANAAENGADNNIRPVDASLISVDSRDRPVSGLSNGSSFLSVQGIGFMEDSDMDSSLHSSVGYVSVRRETFMSDSEDERSRMSTITNGDSSFSSDSSGSSVSPASTIRSGSSSNESTLVSTSKGRNKPSNKQIPQNTDSAQSTITYACTKCGHAHVLSNKQLFKYVLNLPPRPKSYPCELRDLLQFQPRASITDAEREGVEVETAFANSNETTIFKDNIPAVEETSVHEVNEITSTVAAHLVAGLKLNRVDMGEHLKQTKGKAAGKDSDQCLSELKTHQDEIKNIDKDHTRPKALFTDFMNTSSDDENTQPKVLLGHFTDSVSDDGDSIAQPEVLCPSFTDTNSDDEVTDAKGQTTVNRQRLYSSYDNVQFCWICRVYDNNNNSSNIASCNSTGVDFFCPVSNRYFCRPCKQEHMKRVPDCIIMVRNK